MAALALYDDQSLNTQYYDKKSKLSREDYFKTLEATTTVYVGNLSTYTREEQIYELFSKCGQIKQLVIGLNKHKKIPIGFAFVIYFTHEEAGIAVQLLSRTKLDNKVIRVDWDIGFTEGRQYGRGSKGGQVRNEIRERKNYSNYQYKRYNNSYNKYGKQQYGQRKQWNKNYNQEQEQNVHEQDPGPRKWQKNYEITKNQEMQQNQQFKNDEYA